MTISHMCSPVATRFWLFLFSSLPITQSPRAPYHSLPQLRVLFGAARFLISGKEDGMTPKQQRFCEEYLIDCNGTQAAIRAGYSKHTADRIASENLGKPEIQAYLQTLMSERQKATIASAEEVLEYLTSVVRGETKSAYLAVVGTGDGMSEATIVDKAPAEADRLKAAELLGKRYAMFTQKVEMDVTPVVVDGYEDIED